MNSMQFEFDAVMAHLYKQGRPAKDYEGTCLYKAEQGLSCAVGCRIPDEMYDENMESNSLETLLQGYEMPVEVRAYSNMFVDLQIAHDQCQTLRNGEFNFYDLLRRMLDVAETYNLVFKVPKL